MQLPRQDVLNLFITEGQNWSSRLIIEALARQGFSLDDLEGELGLKKNSIRNVFYRPCERYEEAIAEKIGVGPEVIWPRRYLSDSRLTA